MILEVTSTRMDLGCYDDEHTNTNGRKPLKMPMEVNTVVDEAIRRYFSHSDQNYNPSIYSARGPIESNSAQVKTTSGSE